MEEHSEYAEPQSPKEQFTFVTELYEGHPILVIPVKTPTGKEGKYPVKMGYGKLKAVLDNLAYCQAWCAQQEKLKNSSPSVKGFKKTQ